MWNLNSPFISIVEVSPGNLAVEIGWPPWQNSTQ